MYDIAGKMKTMDSVKRPMMMEQGGRGIQAVQRIFRTVELLRVMLYCWLPATGHLS